MYIPDLSLARHRVQIADRGTVVCFYVCEVEYLSQDDPYRPILQELSKEGLNRNVFMVDQNGLPIWRVADYVQPSPDCFVGIHAVSESSEYILGVTFSGYRYHISLSDGTLTVHHWSKL